MQWQADIASVSHEITGSTFMMHANAVISLEWPLMIRSPETDDITGPQGRLLVSILVHRASAVRNPQITAEMWNRLWTLCVTLLRSIRGRSLSLSQSQAGGGTEKAVWTRVTRGQQGRPSHSRSWTSKSESTAHICWKHDWQTHRKQDLKLTVWRSMCRWKHMWARNTERFSLAITTSLNTSPYY